MLKAKLLWYFLLLLRFVLYVVPETYEEGLRVFRSELLNILKILEELFLDHIHNFPLNYFFFFLI